MGTGASLSASERVQRLQTALQAKAKEAPGFRFYSLSDKVWRDDVLAVAWQAVRRNGGAAGVDGETVADIESLGVDRWLGALARDLKAGTYRPRAVRQWYRFGRNYRPDTGAAYSGTRPTPESVRSICRRVSELTPPRDGLRSAEVVVARLNRVLTGWANYFSLGQVSPAYRAVDQHTMRRLRQWLCRKHKVRFGKYVRFPNERLRLETESGRGVRHRQRAKAAGNSYPLPPTATAPVVDSTCATLGSGEGMLRSPEVARFVADHLHRAAVLVDAVACGPQACLLVIVALTVPAGGVSPPGAKRHSSRTGA